MHYVFLKYKSFFVAGCFVIICFFSTGINFISPKVAIAETQEERQSRLTAELVVVEKEIEEQRKILAVRKKESGSLQRDVAILNAKLKEAELVIKAKNLSIQRLGRDINNKTVVIGGLVAKINKGRDSLSQLLRKTNQIDSISIVEVVLGSDDFSTFFLM